MAVKTSRMEIRLTPEQKDILRAQAQKSGMTVSEYIIHMCNL